MYLFLGTFLLVDAALAGPIPTAMLHVYDDGDGGGNIKLV